MKTENFDRRKGPYIENALLWPRIVFALRDLEIKLWCPRLPTNTRLSSYRTKWIGKRHNAIYQHMRGADKLVLTPVGGQNSTLFEFGWRNAVMSMIFSTSTIDSFRLINNRDIIYEGAVIPNYLKK